MAGFDVHGPRVRGAEGYPAIVEKVTVLRLQLSILQGKPSEITNQTAVANGFGQKAHKGVFLVGPTDLALSTDNTLYVSDAVANRVRDRLVGERTA
jgi:hypothetical protein